MEYRFICIYHYREAEVKTQKSKVTDVDEVRVKANLGISFISAAAY
jgi:hypothetical protein